MPNDETSSSRGWPFKLRLRALQVAAHLVLALVVATGCSDASDGGSAEGQTCSDLKVALMAPLTGDQGVFGEAGVDMGEWVLNEFNEANPDCDVELERFDTQGDPTQAAALAREVAGDRSIIAVVGPTNSGEVESAAPILEAAEVPYVTPQATAEGLSDKGWKFFHRTVGSDGQEGPADARYIVDQLKSTKVAVIDNGIPYGVGLADIVAGSLEELSATVVDRESIDIAGSDYSATVNRVLGTEPETVFCGCLYSDAGRLLKQLRAAGYEGHFMGGAGTFVPQIVEAAGSEAAEGFVAASAGQDPSQTRDGQAWLDRWNRVSDGKQLGLYAPEFYNATIAITEAIGAGNTSRADVNDYLYPRDFAGATGPFTFDEHGDVETTTVYFYVVKDGEFAPEYSVQE